MTQEHIETVLKGDLVNFKRRMKEVVASTNGISPLTSHFVKFQGKHLRPIILMLAAKAIAPKKALNKDHLNLAVTMELIHNTALVHDDILDESKLRRSVQTYNQVWGNEMAVIFGDYLFARMFTHITDIKSADILKNVSIACNRLCLGEMQHLNKRFDPFGITQKEYFDIIDKKTASLFELSAYLGAVSTTKDKKLIEAFKQFGRNFGMAYQIMDDYKDIMATDEDSGKSTGSDLRKGKITLPIIRTMDCGPAKYRLKLKNLIKSMATNGKNLSAKKKELSGLLEQTGSLDYTYQQAKDYARKANENISSLPDSVYKDLLISLTQSILK